MNRRKWHQELFERCTQLSNQCIDLQDIEDPLAHSIKAQEVYAAVNDLIRDIERYVYRYPLEDRIEIHDKGIGIIPMQEVLDEARLLKKVLQDPSYCRKTEANENERLDELVKKCSGV